MFLTIWPKFPSYALTCPFLPAVKILSSMLSQTTTSKYMTKRLHFFHQLPPHFFRSSIFFSPAGWMSFWNAAKTWPGASEMLLLFSHPNAYKIGSQPLKNEYLACTVLFFYRTVLLRKIHEITTAKEQDIRKQHSRLVWEEQMPQAFAL